MNDNILLIGSILSPARLSFKMAIPGDGRNQRTITIDAIHSVEPFYVDSVSNFSDGSFSDAFSDGFAI